MNLTDHPFFAAATGAQIKALQLAARPQALADGELVFDEGVPADDLFLVLAGTVVFRKRIPGGEWLAINRCQAGEHFGEIGVLTGEPRSLRAVAEGPVELVRIPGAALKNYLKSLNGPAGELFNSVVRHLHHTTTQYVSDMVRKEKLSVVGSMMNTIVHDFRNPFCLISLSSQLLRQKHTDDETLKLCRTIETQVARMGEMTTELAEFSRGERSLRKTRLNLREVIDEFQALNFPYFDDEKIKVLVEVPNLYLEAEKAKLFRVLQNLVGNAIEALGDRAGRIEIRAHGSRKEKLVILEIADTAGGIPEAIRGRFFEPFVTHGKHNGTGLGTAIVKSIVEAHGGSIEFETETGRGTTFTIKLPAA